MGLNHAVNEELLSSNGHYERLLALHHELEEEIKSEAAHPLADVLRLKTLKRKKLLVADEMFIMEKKLK